MDIIVGLIFWKAVEDMLEFEEYKVKLNNMKPTLDGLGSALKLDDARSEIAELEAESAKEGFWNDLDRSQKVQKRMKQLQQKCEKYEKLQSTWEDLMTICEMALEENDDSMLGELETDYAKLESELEAMRLSTLLSGEYDANNVILSIHPGAGGTEAQDWAQMLYRMYTRWAERHGYTYTLMDWQDGEEAGIKRSHFQNLENCREMLRAKLAEIKEREHLEKISDIKGVQMKIDFGSAIRSYVFMPYTLAKDARTGFENGNINAVMDGDIDGFINAYLAMKAGE